MPSSASILIPVRNSRFIKKRSHDSKFVFKLLPELHEEHIELSYWIIGDRTDVTLHVFPGYRFSNTSHSISGFMVADGEVRSECLAFKSFVGFMLPMPLCLTANIASDSSSTLWHKTAYNIHVRLPKLGAGWLNEFQCSGRDNRDIFNKGRLFREFRDGGTSQGEW